MNRTSGPKALLKKRLYAKVDHLIETERHRKLLSKMIDHQIEENVQFFSEEMDAELMMERGWIYSRDLGLIVPEYGGHEWTISFLFNIESADAVKDKFDDVIKDYVVDVFGSKVVTKEWLKTPGNITAPSLMSSLAVCYEEKLTNDEYNFITREAKHKVVSPREVRV